MAELRTPDLCVIGAGPAGLAAALFARELGAEVVLVEAATTGGGRLGAGGTVSLRALGAAAAEIHAAARAGRLGLKLTPGPTDWARLVRAARDSARPIERDLAIERVEALGVTVLTGTAQFTDRRRLRVGDTVVRARRFIVATGSRPAVPEIAGLAETPHLTADTVLDHAPEAGSLVVLGAGALALELAQTFHRLGAPVTLVDTGDPLPGVDPELAGLLLRELRAEGIDQLWNATIGRVAPAPDGGIVLEFAPGEGPLRLTAASLVVAGPRVPDVEDLALERAGVRFQGGRRPGIAVTPTLSTTNPRVYAAGEVTGAEPSDALAATQGRLAAHHALFGDRWPHPRAMVPRAILTDPGVAEIGLTETEAKKRLRGRYRLVRVPYTLSDRARVERSGPGLMKLVTGPGGRVLGGGIVGREATEMVSILAFAIDRGLRATDLARFVPAYPAHAELLRRLGELASESHPDPWRKRLVALRRYLP